MKTIEEIEKEYESFTPTSTHIKTLQEFVAFIEVGIDDTYDIEKDAQKEMRENKRWEIESKIVNFFFFFIGKEEVNLYAEDNKILLEQLALINQYREIFMRMFIYSSEDNLSEMIKLVDFASMYYGKHIDYLEYRRDQLETSLKGFSLTNYGFEDNREVVSQFLDQKLTFLEEQEKTKEKQLRKALQNG